MLFSVCAELNSVFPDFSDQVPGRAPGDAGSPAAADGGVPVHRLQRRPAGGLKEDHAQRKL